MDSRDKFAQMLREGYETLDPEKEQREYIRELLRRKEQQRKRRIKTITAVAAAFLIVVGAVLAVGGCIGPVEADKNDKTKVEKQGESVIISDENADGQEVGSESVIETDWNKVDKLKEKYPEMITFTDVPEGMEFVSVETEKQDLNTLRVTYTYMKDSREIYVYQQYQKTQENETNGVEERDEIISYKNYKVHLKKGDVIKAAIYTDYGIIDIMGKLEKQDVLEVLDKIKAS